MTFRSAWLILPFTAFSLVGCGTVQNLNPTKQILVWGVWEDDQPKTTRVFGGVREDLAGLSGLGFRDEYAALNTIVLGPFWVIDLPFSFIGDMITLPYTAVYTLCSPRLTPNATEEGKQPWRSRAVRRSIVPPPRRTFEEGELTPLAVPRSSESPDNTVDLRMLSSRIDLMRGCPTR